MAAGNDGYPDMRYGATTKSSDPSDGRAVPASLAERDPSNPILAVLKCNEQPPLQSKPLAPLAENPGALVVGRTSCGERLAKLVWTQSDPGYLLGLWQ